MATTLTCTYPILIGGAWKEAGEPLDVTNPYTGEVVGRTFQADAATLEEAVQATVRAFQVTRKLPSYERAAILRKISDPERLGPKCCGCNWAFSMMRWAGRRRRRGWCLCRTGVLRWNTPAFLAGCIRWA